MTETEGLPIPGQPKTELKRGSAESQNWAGPKTDQPAEQHNTSISHINLKTYKDNMGRVIGICDICSRNSGVVEIKQHEFGEDKELLRIEGTKVVTYPNPLYFSIVICSSCMHLLRKLKREGPQRKPEQRYLIAKSYRELRPVKEKK